MNYAEHVEQPTVIIKNLAIESIIKESSRFYIRETGGILMGQIDKEKIIITHASGPGPDAKHGFSGFRRDVWYCQEFINKVYDETNGRITYVGEWHKHYNYPVPSHIDNDTMLEIASTPECRLNQPLLLIANSERLKLSYHLFFYSNDKICKKKCSIVTS